MKNTENKVSNFQILKTKLDKTKITIINLDGHLFSKFTKSNEKIK